ncbi:MAG: hypothetical protein AAGJ74_14855 [Pseudomonadota bacterium]
MAENGITKARILAAFRKTPAGAELQRKGSFLVLQQQDFYCYVKVQFYDGKFAVNLEAIRRKLVDGNNGTWQGNSDFSNRLAPYWDSDRWWPFSDGPKSISDAARVFETMAPQFFERFSTCERALEGIRADSIGTYRPEPILGPITNAKLAWILADYLLGSSRFSDARIAATYVIERNLGPDSPLQRDCEEILRKANAAN